MHTRDRHVIKVLKKRAKMFPVLGILGARQVGKSTFLMKHWSPQHNAVYLTFDKQEIAIRATRSPEQFLLAETDNQDKRLIIDEAHKVPHIFDSIKALVDENRRVGEFTLSGSVEFSSKSGVRESLAGRMGITRLYPMTLREVSNHKFYCPWVQCDFDKQPELTPKSVETWLQRGGMPIFCNYSDTDERFGVIQSWLDAICYRDLKQLKDYDYDSELAYHLLITFAAQPTVSLSKVASEFGHTTDAIKKHLAALEALFLLYKIPAFASPNAQPQYRLFDAGVLQCLLGGQQTIFSRHASLITLLINELYAQHEYAGKIKPELYYYKTRGGAEVDLVLKTKKQLIGIDCATTIDITEYKQRGMRSFLNNNPDAKGYIVAPVQKGYKIEKNMFVIPWILMG